MTQMLVGQATTLTFTVDVDGDPTNQGDGTLSLIDLDGDTHVAPTLTTVGSGVYTATVPVQSAVGWYTARLTFGSTVIDHGHLEVVDGLLFSETQARTFDPTILAAAAVTDDELADTRARVADWLEAETGRSWVRRFRRLEFWGNGLKRLSAAYPARSLGPSGGQGANRDIATVLSATINGTAVNDVTTDGTAFYRTGGFTSPTSTAAPNVVIDVAYGLNHRQSGVDRVALLETVERLTTSRAHRTATRVTDGDTVYGWDPQNNGRPSRIPEVNAWVRSHDVRAAIA